MSGKKKDKTIICCVRNCQKEVPLEEAIVIEGKYFCGTCGVAFYRSTLRL